MKDKVGTFDKSINQSLISDISLMDFNLVLDMGDIGARSGGEVVEDDH